MSDIYAASYIATEIQPLLARIEAKVSKMSDAPNLELLQRQQRQILDEMGEFRDQLTVLTAICMRVEGAVNALTTEVRAVHSRHSRLERRIKELEGDHDRR